MHAMQAMHAMHAMQATHAIVTPSRLASDPVEV